MTRVKAAINGGTRALNVPVTPAEIAADVVAVANAGAFAVHFHPRDEEGRESLAPAHVDAAVQAVRASVERRALSPPMESDGGLRARRSTSSIPFGVTTGAWIVRDPRERLAQVSAWQVLPDFASVNFDEDGAEEVARALLAMGVPIEAGLSSVDGARRYVASGIACLRVLLEPQNEDADAARTNVEAMERVINGDATPRLLHGTGATVWAMVRLATARGYDTRVGFEDSLLFEDGTAAPSNADLIHAALRLVSSTA